MPDKSDNAIDSITYSPERQELRIAFADGRAAIHLAVPNAIYAALDASPEPMRFYLEHIRDTFRRA
ncbi:MAG: KTSC domain-containing protein [Hyphomicrobiaceae bacterium]